jgi:hypothetical protein
MPAETNRLEIDAAPWFRALYLAMGVCLLGGGVAVFVATADVGVRWMTLVLLGGGGVVCAWFALSSRRRLTLDQEGIRGRPFGLVRWGDVEDVFVRWNNLNRVLGLKVREPSRYYEHLPGWRRALWSMSRRAGFGDVSFDITGLRVGSEEIVKMVRARTHGLTA